MDNLCLLPHTPFPDVGISLALVAVVDFLAHVNKLQFHRDGEGGDRLVGSQVDGTNDRVVRVESATVAFEHDAHLASFKA